MNRTNTNTKAMSTLKTHFQPVSNSGDDHQSWLELQPEFIASQACFLKIMQYSFIKFFQPVKKSQFKFLFYFILVLKDKYLLYSFFSFFYCICFSIFLKTLSNSSAGFFDFISIFSGIISTLFLQFLLDSFQQNISFYNKVMSQNKIYWTHTPPTLAQIVRLNTYMHITIKRLGQVAGAIGATGPKFRQTCKCVRQYARLRPLLHKVVCATISGCVCEYTCMRHNRACASIL